MKKITDIIAEAEQRIHTQCGVMARLSVEYTLPEHAHRALMDMCTIWRTQWPDLLKRDRHRRLVTQRQIVMLYLRTKAKLSFTNISRLFSYDHSTIIAACKQAENHIELDDRLFMEYYKPVKHLFNEL